MTPDDEQIVRKTYQMTTARRAEITPTPLQAAGTPAPRAAIAQATSYLRSALTS